MTRHNLTNIRAQIVSLLFSLALALGSSDLSAQTASSDNMSLKKCGEYKVEGLSENTLASDGQKVFFGTENGSILAVDPAAASSLWTTELGGEIVSNLLVADASIFVVTNPLASEGTSTGFSILRSLSKETGITNWSMRLPFSERIYLGSVRNSVIAVGREGLIVAVEMQTGSPIWKAQFSGAVTALPYFSASGIVFGTSEKRVVLISIEDGKELARNFGPFVPTAVVASGDSLVVGDERGNVALIKAAGGKPVWKFKSGAGISHVAVSRKGILVTSRDNFIYLISMYNGDVIWKRRMPGRIIDSLLVAEHLIFSRVYGESSAFLIDLENGKITDRLTQNEKNYIQQVPVLIGNSKIVLATAVGLELYGLKPCSEK